MYDDAAFQLFAVAILATIWIPWCLFHIIRFLRRSLHTKTPLEEAKEAWCSCSLCQQKAEKLTTKTGLQKIGISNIIFVFTTIAFFLLSVRVYQANLTAEPPFDPFAILGVSDASTPREIKKAFRRLSIVHHPDKNRDDPTAGERFIKISKAFAALTDDTAKKNWIKYGNPDGFMGTTLGLGLPEWVAENGSVVLTMYFLFMVLLFPLIVGTWWHRRSQQFNSEVLTQTLMLYGETLKQTSKFRDLLGAFCGSIEFSKLYSSENDEHLQSIVESLKRLGNTDIRKTKSFFETSQVQISNLFVLTAYLARIPIPKQLQYVLDAMLMRCEPLLTVMTDTSGAFQRPECRSSWNKQPMRGHTTYLATCIGMQQCLIQGLDEKVSPLLQIPHFTEQEVKYCFSSRNAVRTIYDFMKLETEDQRKLLRGFSDDQFLDVQAFCSRYPSANLDVSEAYVEEEEDSSVHAGDTVTVKAKLTVMRRSGSAFSPHTPNVPYRKEEVWWIWVADQKHRAPIEVKRLLPRMARGHDPNRRRRSRDSCCGVGEEEEQHDEHLRRLTKDPRVTVFDLKFRFLAPKAGLYNLEVVAACDCYKGASKTAVIKMKVGKEVEPPAEDSVRYFDTDDESASDESSSSEKEETDDEYEYVTDDGEDDDGEKDENNAEDRYGVTGDSHGDPAS